MTIFNNYLMKYITRTKSRESDHIKKLFKVWKYFYEKVDHKYLEPAQNAIITLLKAMSRSRYDSIRLIPEALRESEKAVVFAIDYEKLLPPSIKVMRKLAKRCKMYNDEKKMEAFEELSHLHSSDLWNETIGFLKKYINDKRMTTATLKLFINLNKDEIHQPKKINLQDYLLTNYVPFYNDLKYYQVQRSRIEFSYLYYLINSAYNSNLEAIYLLSKQNGINENILMKSIFSRKMYILDTILFKFSIYYFCYEDNYLSNIPLPGFDYKPTREDILFCKKIISSYPLDIISIYPDFSDYKDKRSLLKNIQTSDYAVYGQNHKSPMDYSNYKFFYYQEYSAGKFYLPNSGYNFKTNQSFRNAFDIPEKIDDRSLNQLKYLASLYVACYECIKPPQNMR